MGWVRCKWKAKSAQNIQLELIIIIFTHKNKYSLQLSCCELELWFKVNVHISLLFLISLAFVISLKYVARSSGVEEHQKQFLLVQQVNWIELNCWTAYAVCYVFLWSYVHTAKPMHFNAQQLNGLNWMRCGLGLSKTLNWIFKFKRDIKLLIVCWFCWIKCLVFILIQILWK